MMLNLLIVDDEPMFREGLVKTVNWNKLGVKVIAEAINGLDALEILKKNQIDLVLTDIKMPELNGLELIQEATKINPDLAFIVLSAYDDFNFVKEAFHLGIVDYILKSEVNEDEIAQIIQRQIAVKQASDFTISDYAEKNDKLFLSQLIRNCVERRLDITTIPELNKFFGVDDNLPVYSACLRFHSVEEDSEFICSKVDEIIFEFNDWVGYWENHHVLILFYRSEESEVWQDYYEQCEMLRKNLLENIGINRYLTVGFSMGKNSNSLARTKREAQTACEFSFLRGINKCIGYNHFEKNLNNSLVNCENIFKNFVVFFDNRKFVNETKYDFVLNPILCNSEQIKELKNLYKKYYFHIQAYCENNDLINCDELNSKLMEYQYLESNELSMEVLNKWLLSIIGLIKNISEKSLSLSRRVVKFLEQNYQNQISLVDAANFLEVNPSYLSRVFSREMGKGFSQVLLEMRIRQAVNFLETTNLKSYEIADKVGFLNPESFSRGFKKVMGISPRQYHS